METYFKYRDDILLKKNKLINLLKKLKETNSNVLGYGAPAKATTLLNYLNLSEEDIKIVVEDNPLKVDKFIPGTKIKLVSSNQLDRLEKYNFVVLAWNFYELIIKKNKKIYPNSKFYKFN